VHVGQLDQDPRLELELRAAVDLSQSIFAVSFRGGRTMDCTDGERELQADLGALTARSSSAPLLLEHPGRLSRVACSDRVPRIVEPALVELGPQLGRGELDRKPAEPGSRIRRPTAGDAGGGYLDGRGDRLVRPLGGLREMARALFGLRDEISKASVDPLPR